MISIKVVEKRNNYPSYIRAEVELFPEDKEYTRVCIRPRVVLMYWNESDSVRLTVGDYDDLDLSVIYLGKTKEDAKKIFHELLNFLKDIDMQVINEDKFFDYEMNKDHISSFFPDLGCHRYWEFWGYRNDIQQT
jgi:hypothetical protein